MADSARKLLIPLLCAAAAAPGACGPAGAGKDPAAPRQDRTAPPRSAPDKAAAGPVAAARATPELGRCHAESCSWSLTRSQTAVKADAAGTLVRLSLLGGTSNNSDGDPAQARIRWNVRPHDVFVFCSKRLPAVMMRMDAAPAPAGAGEDRSFPSYQVDVLDFVNGIPGALESSANLFARTCYPGDDWTSPDFARRNGLPGFEDEPEVTIESPGDIFRAAVELPGA